jgi:hypothetical protein
MSTPVRQLVNSIPGRLAVFGAALVALFALGAVAGRAIEPSAPGSGAGSEGEMSGHGSTGHGSAGHEAAEAGPGLRLVVLDRELPLGATRRLRFRVVDATGAPVRSFDVLHTKRMHLILARRDLTGFQHLHPRMRTDGTWVAPVRFDEAGPYRLFADFSHEGTATTLAGDLAVDGDAELRQLPDPAPTATSDGGYEVRLLGKPARAGAETELGFAVSRDGHPVATEPYLGAGGHLVALREGDLAFLHVHPTEDGAEGHGHGDTHPHGTESIAFATTFPTPGAYRLFLQVKVDGRVETVAFTVEVER